MCLTGLRKQIQHKGEIESESPWSEDIAPGVIRWAV